MRGVCLIQSNDEKGHLLFSCQLHTTMNFRLTLQAPMSTKIELEETSDLHIERSLRFQALKLLAN